MGSNVGADGTLKVDAGSIARATGGINGDWSYFANANDQFLGTAALPLAYGATGGSTTIVGIPVTGNFQNYLGNHTEENLSKITYYTPRWMGLQVGVSYLPDQSNTGQGSIFTGGPTRTDYNGGLSQNIWTGGLNYDNKFGDFGVAASATGEWGTAQDNTTAGGVTTAYNDLKAWTTGAKVSYMGFSLAGSYGDWGKSNTLKAADSKKTWYYDLGAAYEYGPFGASVTYLYSSVDCGITAQTAVGAAGVGINGNCAATDVNGKNKFDSISTGVDYKLAPGLTPYAEVTWYNQNSVTNTLDNKGYVAIVGTQLNF